MEDVGMQWREGSRDEMRDAIMFGKLVSHSDGVSFYQYRGDVYTLSDEDLVANIPQKEMVG